MWEVQEVKLEWNDQRGQWFQVKLQRWAKGKSCRALISQSKDMGFHSKCNEKLLGSLKHKRDIIPFMFFKGW